MTCAPSLDFNFKTYYDNTGYVVDEYNKALKISATPGLLTGATVTANSYKVGDITFYTISFTATHGLTTDGIIIVAFPV